MSDLRIKNLCSCVPGLTVQTLQAFDLELRGAEIAFISGPSGSGKSLLLRAIADLDPATGQVWLENQARSSMKAHQWRQKVCYLATESAWWFETVGEHFSHRDNDYWETLGFGEDVLSWKTARISSGEKQRLALLRCLSRAPDVLLLDEPTASLDEARTRLVEQVVTAYSAKNKAPVIWVSHDVQQMERVAQRILNIQPDGCIEEVAR